MMINRLCTLTFVLIYYIQLQCPFVCMSVCTPLFFRHDRPTATTFGTHMRIDMGIIRTQRKLTHPTPGGSRWNLGGQQFKSPGNVMNCPDNQLKKCTPTHQEGEVLGVTIQQSGKCHELSTNR